MSTRLDPPTQPGHRWWPRHIQEPALCHTCGREHLVSSELSQRQSRRSFDDSGEQDVAVVAVVMNHPGLRLGLCCCDGGDTIPCRERAVHSPARLVFNCVAVAQAAGVRKQMDEMNRIPCSSQLRDPLTNRIIDRDRTIQDQRGDRSRSELLGNRGHIERRVVAEGLSTWRC